MAPMRPPVVRASAYAHKLKPTAVGTTPRYTAHAIVPRSALPTS